MVKREIMLLALCALFVAYVPFTSYHFDTTSQFVMTSILKSAYGQTTGPGGPGYQDPSVGDNSTNLSNPGDVSSGIGNSTDIIIQNDTTSGPDATIPGVSNDLANPAGNATDTNATTTQAVPEFGPISILILTTAIISIILISTRISNFHKY